MSACETIRREQDARGVARLTLARAESHNALNATMIRELSAVAAQLAADTSVRVVVLAGEGKTFCAGGDLGWMREQTEKDRAGRMAASSELARMLRDLDSLPKPLIARVQGSAYGGGIGLICVCDLVVASAAARFALAEVRLGLIPATIGPYVVRRIGEGAARRLMLNGSTIDADLARDLGLVSVVAADDGLDSAVEAEVGEFLKCAPGAVADAKALCRHLARNPAQDQPNWTAERLADRWETEEAREGINCFLARQTPSWAKGAR
jgi:methylglutaconyl-CoA hydratase